VNTETLTKTEYICHYCKKSFRRETTLAVHVCEQKKRYQSRNETGVQIGLNSYLKFYEMSQGPSKTKTFDDFAQSPYYRAFVKFGQYCVSIRAVNIPRFTEWLLKNNKKIDYWCSDRVYGEFLEQYLRIESPIDALHRSVEHSIRWGHETGNPANDYLRYGNDNTICYAVTTGRISAWVLYNSQSGQEFLARLSSEQLAMIWSNVDTDFWQQKFRDYPADIAYIKDILKQAGW
jgi:hypothetical protein